MRKLLNFLILIALSFIVSCSGKLSDSGRSGVKGRVKSIKEIRCEPDRSDDRWVAGESLTNSSRTIYFDKKGNLITSYTLSLDGDTVSRSTCVRENGDMVAEVFYTRVMLSPTESEMYETSKIVYDRVSEEQVNWEIWKGDERMNEGATYFDNMGRMVMQVQVRNNKEESLHYLYDKILMTEYYREDISGERIDRQLYEYDDFDKHGNWQLMLIYADDEKIIPDVAISREIDYY